MEFRHFRLRGFGENNRCFTYVLVLFDIFIKFGWCIPLKNKNAQLIKDSFENIRVISKRSLNLIETDDGKKLYTKSSLIC